MAKKIKGFIFIAGILSSLFLSSSCQLAKESYLMGRGYLASGRGDYQDALLSYLALEETSMDSDIVSYNIGVIYQALDEPESVKKWLEAEKSDNIYTKVSALYNIGLYYYDDGKYQEAYTYFLQALKLSPHDMDIKINLELAYQRLAAVSGNNTSAESSDNKPDAKKTDKSYILQYLEKKEQNRWKSKELTPDITVTNDW